MDQQRRLCPGNEAASLDEIFLSSRMGHSVALLASRCAQRNNAENAMARCASSMLLGFENVALAPYERNASGMGKTQRSPAGSVCCGIHLGLALHLCFGGTGAAGSIGARACNCSASNR